MNTLYIVRGLPGSGKTTLANAIVGEASVIEADDAWRRGNAVFDRLTEALKRAARSARGEDLHKIQNELGRRSGGDRGYLFNPDFISMAHEAAVAVTRDRMRDGADACPDGGDALAVSNTFSQPWEARPYFDLAAEFDYAPFVVEAQNRFGSLHGVDERVVDNMTSRWLPLTPSFS